MAAAGMNPSCGAGKRYIPECGCVAEGESVAGCFGANLGTSAKPPPTSASIGAWVDRAVPFRPAIGGAIVAAATVAGASTTTPAELQIDLLDGGLTLDLAHRTTNRLVAGSVRFTLGGLNYLDQGDGILRDADGLQLGTLDYAAGRASLTFWPASASAPPTVTSALSQYGFWSALLALFRTELAPLKPESLQVQVTTLTGESLSAVGDADGKIEGDGITGYINYEFGVASLFFGRYVPAEDPADPDIWTPILVDPSTLRYNAVAYSYLPLDADILGIDPVRLPSDGRVPVYRKGGIVYVMHTNETDPITPTVEVPFAIGRTRLAWARVIDADGQTVSGDRYELDRASGQIMFTDLTDVPLPLTVRHTVADLRMVTDAQISGWLQLSRPLTHDYPAQESVVASCLLFGDRRARVSTVFDQASWDGTWQDAVKGSEATATLNTIDFPITVTNEGADTDRWLLRCTNASTHQWELISERRGLVWSGTYAPGGADVAPINARTRTWDVETGQWIGGTPYLIIPGHANGGGWSTGNVVRINTVGAIADFWVARSIQQSDEPLDDGYDSVEIYALGNVDRP